MTSISLPTEADTLALGAAIAQHSNSGDVITLSGSLGAGKTVLARGFIRHHLGARADVASPTFTLVQVYDAASPEIWHFDLYRIEHPDEVQELGLEDAITTGISLIEWPDRAGGWLPRDRLDITITVDPKTTQDRTATLVGGPSWSTRLESIQNTMGAS